MTTEENTTRRALLQAAAGGAVAGTAGCADVVTTPADASSRYDLRGNVDTFVGPSWLEDRGLEDVVALDARPRDAFRRERIYGARRVPLEGITARRSGDGGLEPDASEIAATFADIGVGRDADVIVYGASVGSRVTRVVFALEYLGHRGDVRALNGGFEGWNGRLGTGPAPELDAVGYDPEPAPELVATRDWIAERLERFAGDGSGDADGGGDALLDVRVPEAYLGATGSDALDPAHDRHGHLPGAIDVHWVGNVDGTRLRDPAELSRLYTADAGVDEGSTVVVYGDGNVDPTQTWVVLRALGVEDVRLYDGGFGEWANVPEDERGRYPVETKTNVVVETEGELGGDDSGDFSCTG